MSITELRSNELILTVGGKSAVGASFCNPYNSLSTETIFILLNIFNRVVGDL